MPTVLRVSKARKPEAVEATTRLLPEDVNVRVELIQALIPLGLLAVEDALRGEVEALAGPRYARGHGQPGHVRWSKERGSIFLLDQKVPMTYQRVRDQRRQSEVPLRTYAALQQPRHLDEGLLRRVLHGLSCRRYRECAETIPAAFGLTASSISRRFIRASARKLQALQQRRLDDYEIVVVVLDGKTFGDDGMVIAVGITATGHKVILGFVQTATENKLACAAFLRELIGRGLRYEEGLLVVIDGSKGLRQAVGEVFGPASQVQRCAWHKRENVLSYLPKREQAVWRAKLQRAYEQPIYDEAKRALEVLQRDLRLRNESAARSLAEGLEETLTLHRLDIFTELGVSLKTTNVLESIMAQVQDRVGKVDRWRNSQQKERWLATALLDIEPRLRRIKGYRALPRLQQALLQKAKGLKAA